MHYIRAGLAIAFFLGISKEKFWQQSPRKLIINSLIASCIHFTALLFTFSLLFMKNKKRMIFLFFLAALSVSVFCFKIPFSHLIGKHIAGVLNFQRVQYYVDKMYSDVWGPVLRIYGRTILYFMIGIFFYFRNVKNKKKLVNFVIAISIVGLIVNTLFWDFGLIYGRLVTYFSLVPLVLIPYGLGMVKLKYSRVVMGFLVLILFFYLFYLSFYITKAHEILFPYEYCTDLGLNMKN
jgi:hypothetical protein